MGQFGLYGVEEGFPFMGTPRWRHHTEPDLGALRRACFARPSPGGRRRKIVRDLDDRDSRRTYRVLVEENICTDVDSESPVQPAPRAMPPAIGHPPALARVVTMPRRCELCELAWQLGKRRCRLAPLICFGNSLCGRRIKGRTERSAQQRTPPHPRLGNFSCPDGRRALRARCCSLGLVLEDALRSVRRTPRSSVRYG